MKYALAIGLSLFSVSASAQAQNKVQVFAGYSFLHFDTQGLPVHSNANGGIVEAEYDPLPFLGIKADVSGHYNTLITGLGAHSYTYMFGPTVFHNDGPYRLFAHALFGANSVAVSIAPVTVSQRAFAMAFGGGLDVELNRWIAVRAVQADYLYTQHNFGAGHQNNLRLSTGLVFKF